MNRQKSNKPNKPTAVRNARLLLLARLSHMGMTSQNPDLLHFKLERQLPPAQLALVKRYLTSFFEKGSLVASVSSHRDSRAFGYLFSKPERAQKACKKICQALHK